MSTRITQLLELADATASVDVDLTKRLLSIINDLGELATAQDEILDNILTECRTCMNPSLAYTDTSTEGWLTGREDLAIDILDMIPKDMIE